MTAPTATVTPQPGPAPSTGSLVRVNFLSGLVSNLLGWAGFSSSMTNSPESPAATPLAWTLLAAARRQLGNPAVELVDTATGGQTTAETLTAAAAALTTNQAPVIISASAGAPSSFLGMVTGKVTATDADNDILRYTATATAKGKVRINAGTGAFTYTPTSATRHAASALAATASDKEDTVTVTVTDGHGGVASRPVTVAIAPLNSAPTVGVTVSRPDTTTGVVTGTVTGTDLNKDPLQYSATTSTPKGLLALDATTGAFTYTPTVAARHAAAAIGAPASAKTDAFTVTVTDAHGGTTTKTVTVAVAARNNAPTVAPTPTVNAPNPDTGIATGSLGAADADGDPLTYTATPTKGAITFDAGGSFTYTPTDAARAAAGQVGAPASARQDTFTVTVSDGYGGIASKSVTLDIAPTSASTDTGLSLVGNNVTLTVAGIPQGPPLLSADGSRAVVTTGGDNTVRVAVIDTTTGAQIGTTFSLTGYWAQPAVLSANGIRAVVTTTSTDLVTGGTRVAVIDTTTGAQIGATLTLPGSQSATWSANDTRALVSTVDGDWNAGFTTRVTVIDTTTVSQTGTTLSITGRQQGPPLFSSDGTHALIATDIGVAVIDTTTGTQIGTTLTGPGSIYSVGLTPDASRALITTRVDDAAAHTSSTLVKMVDLTTGSQIGNTLTLEGAPWSAPVNAGATHSLITTYVADAVGYNILNTQLAVIDATTGAQTGTTVVVPGRLSGSPVFSSDGTRALVANTSGLAVIIDTTSGAEIGPILTVSGQPQAFDLLTADGSRALITTTMDHPTYPVEYTTLLTVIDTATGTQIGTTLTVDGSGTPLLSADGTHALIATAVYDQSAVFTDRHSTRVAVIDTSTGTQTGTTLTLPGAIYGAQVLRADDGHVLITTSPWNPVTYTGSTRMAVFDMATGTQTGSTLTIAGSASSAPLLSPDGTRALIATDATRTTTTVGVLRIG